MKIQLIVHERSGSTRLASRPNEEAPTPIPRSNTNHAFASNTKLDGDFVIDESCLP